MIVSWISRAHGERGWAAAAVGCPAEVAFLSGQQSARTHAH